MSDSDPDYSSLACRKPSNSTLFNLAFSNIIYLCNDEILYLSCPDDYRKISSPEYAKKSLEGVVVNCLREKFRKAVHERIRLSEPCKAEVCVHLRASFNEKIKKKGLQISRVILESEFDVQLDPILYNACKSVSSLLVKTFCVSEERACALR